MLNMKVKYMVIHKDNDPWEEIFIDLDLLFVYRLVAAKTEDNIDQI